MKDATQPLTTTPSTPNADDPTPAPKPGEPEPAKPGDKPSVVPETYAAFVVPDGLKLDNATIESATPIFKELGLSQEQAQRLVDFHLGEMKKAADGPLNAVQSLRTQWQTAVKADPEIGHRIPEVQQEIGKALDRLGDATLTADFKQAMNITGVGDNPAFVKAFYKLAKLIPTEGAHVPGSAPSKHGQDASGQAKPLSTAQAMYPNLP